MYEYVASSPLNQTDASGLKKDPITISYTAPAATGNVAVDQAAVRDAVSKEIDAHNQREKDREEKETKDEEKTGKKPKKANLVTAKERTNILNQMGTPITIDDDPAVRWGLTAYFVGALRLGGAKKTKCGGYNNVRWKFFIFRFITVVPADDDDVLEHEREHEGVSNAELERLNRAAKDADAADLPKKKDYTDAKGAARTGAKNAVQAANDAHDRATGHGTTGQAGSDG